ncbi:MAG: hypothetical protein AAFZ07_02735 [Actinomycetota bacterium]
MITNPTTEQLLLDAARELRESILPAVDDPTVRVAVEMMEQLVRSCGIRAAHEIAWMHDQIPVLEAYCAEVAETLDDVDVGAALEAHRAADPPTLHLDDVVAAYNRISDVASLAMEAALDAGHPDLAAQAGALMRARQDTEAEVRGEFSMPGRG